jgi:hypothetical protein
MLPWGRRRPARHVRCATKAVAFERSMMDFTIRPGWYLIEQTEMGCWATEWSEDPRTEFGLQLSEPDSGADDRTERKSSDRYVKHVRRRTARWTSSFVHEGKYDDGQSAFQRRLRGVRSTRGSVARTTAVVPGFAKARATSIVPRGVV